jgi:putative oxidoreductase
MSPLPSSSTPEHAAHLGGDEPASPVGRAGLIRWVGWGARITLAGLFLWAGIRKVMEPELFLQDIESYELLPYRWAWLTSIWLPFLEITAGAALLTTRRWAQAGAVIIGGMLLVFLVAIISAWARGLSLSCGCFGASTEPANYSWLVVRDLLMLGLVGAIFLTTKHTKYTKN